MQSAAPRSFSQHLAASLLSVSFRLMRPLCLFARAFTRRQKRVTPATEKRQYLFVDEMSDPPARMAWPGDGGLGCCVDSGSADCLSGAVSFIGFASVLVLRWSDAGWRPENAAQGLGLSSHRRGHPWDNPARLHHAFIRWRERRDEKLKNNKYGVIGTD